MLNLENKLFFPYIIHIKTLQGTKEDNTTVPIDLYKLDWSWQEAMVKSKYENWNISYFGKIAIPFVPTLPDKHDCQVKSLIFAIKALNLREIRRCCGMAFLEYNASKQMEYNIREFCVKPSIAYIETAFKLLSDSIFNEKEEFFTRDYTLKILSFHAMLYKFWCYQTNTGSLCNNSGIFILSKTLECAKKIEPESETFELDSSRISDFIKDIHQHQNELQGSYPEKP